MRIGKAAALVSVCALAVAGLATGGASGPPALKDRLLKAGELAGFTPDRPSIVRKADDWAYTCPTGEAQRLRSAGFVAGAREHLRASLKGRDAISSVVQFRSVASAKAEVLHAVRQHGQCSDARFSTFRIPGVPGAHGIAAKQKDGEGYDVHFSDGVFYYDVGAFTIEPKGPPTAADIAAAALRLYRRVHGRTA